MKRLRLLLIFATALAIQAGCSIFDPIGVRRAANPQVILQAFLVAGAPVDSVVLRSTVPADSYYVWMDLDPYALRGANVVITADGGPAHTLTERRPGTYADSSLIARSGQRYSIEVTFPAGHQFSGKRLTAATTVPGQVQIDTVTLSAAQIRKGVESIEELEFPKELADPGRFGITSEHVPFKLWWQRVPASDGYLVGTAAADTSGQSLLRTRWYNDWKNGDYRDPNMRQLLYKSGYPVFPDSVSAEFYWLLFNYQGWYDVVVHAADSAYFDYFVSVAHGPAGQSGSDADFGIVSNVKGGTGVFGSYSADTVRAYVKAWWLPSDNL